MEPENTGEPVAETEAIKPKDFFTRLGGVYLSPKNAFQEIGGSPSVLLPIIALIVIGLLLGFYLVKTVDMQSMMVSQMEKAVDQGRMTKDQLEQQLPIAEKITSIMTLAAPPVISVLTVLIIAGFAKLFSVLVKAQNRFKALFSVTAFAVIAISIIQTILTVLVLHFKGTEDLDLEKMNSVVASNLGAILENFLGSDALPKFVVGLAQAVDIFAIWIIALLSIGFSAVSRKLKTSTAAAWLTTAYIIIAIIRAAFQIVFGA
jgi:hypothetical protein